MNLDKNQIKETIQSEVVKTTQKIAQLLELTKPISPDCAIGRVSRMDAINNKTINENALRKAKVKLKSLEIALQNVDDTNFGICVKCNQVIPVGRILLMPHSPFCVKCVD